MIKWIIQNNLIKANILQEFRDTFTELEIDFEEVKAIPFSNELPEFTPSKVNIFYGSTTLMLNAYNNPNFRNGVFYDPKIFTIENYLDKWGDKMLNVGGQVLSFNQLIEKKVDTKLEWFIRPNEDDKSFAGTTMTREEIKEWYSKILEIDNPNLNADTLIFVSEKKEIKKEWRNFVVNQKVIDSSRYMSNGVLNISTEDCPKEMIQFVEESAAEFSPHDIFVMDVAETSNGFKIIECNCFNGTGFYNHKIKNIVAAITENLKTQITIDAA